MVPPANPKSLKNMKFNLDDEFNGGNNDGNL